ncbi:hypothetical protein SAMN05216350_11119 [Polaromonas sp. YR568]|uniref:hypothetical protein n=1 Tax=Polaromonas sp. YR568 TaxID=1855301 RepID=UPI0008EC6C09|nr:hypothetical protein [Polaromonas sp. YR568]SFU99220.1 hypothetical protein SAMN05216350_11119 [Polaromonas sp. YR568]
MNYHVTHITCNGQAHGLNGYREVVESVIWGLRELGHTVESGLDTFSSSATNIVFGAQMVEMDVLEKLPPSTIVYNFEQLRGTTSLKPQLIHAAANFRIWDYTEANVDVWRSLNADLRIVPVGYAEPLTRIPRAATQDIDVLMYGSPGPDRMDAFFHLCHSGLKTVFVCGLYGSARDELISRSKIIVNINFYTAKKIFEVVRVSYLLANRKAVVADIDPETYIEEDIRAGICVAAPSMLVQECHDIAANESRRRAIEESGFEVIRSRDIRPILEAALANSDQRVQRRV